MGTRSFKAEFLAHYKIAGFFQPEKRGGQKSVHFIIKGGRKEVMKIIDGVKDARFEREMKIYEEYKGNEGIPVVYEISEYDGETIVFEQYEEGDTLEVIGYTYAGNVDMIKELLQRLFSILKPIWKGNYVHRDIKPPNIIIKPDGKPVLLDFGIARLLGEKSITVTGPQPGTWKWAAPEQYAGQKDMISYRTDFFSLGVLAYFLYYNKLPFGDTINDINDKFNSEDESFTIDDACPLKPFLVEAMRFRASHRPRDIDELAKLIL